MSVTTQHATTQEQAAGQVAEFLFPLSRATWEGGVIELASESPTMPVPISKPIVSAISNIYTYTLIPMPVPVHVPVPVPVLMCLYLPTLAI